MKRTNIKLSILFFLFATTSTFFLSDFSLAISNSSSKTDKTSEKKSTNTKLFPILKVYQRAKTIKLSFEQNQKNLSTGIEKKSFGEILIQKKPSKFRWASNSSTDKKPESLFISNEDKALFYTYPYDDSEPGQVVRGNTKQFGIQAAVGLLSGSEGIQKDFEIKDLTPFSFLLKPKKKVGDLSHIELFVEKSTNLVYKIHLVTLLGNTTEILLQKTEFDVVLDAKIFNFTPPKGTEEI